MNWRIFLWGVLVGSCLSSASAALDTNCLSWEVPLLIFLITGGWWGVYWIWKHTHYKVHNFTLVFLREKPNFMAPETLAEEPQCLKVLASRKTHHVYVKVQSRCGFRVKKINFRLLDPDLTNASTTHGVIVGNLTSLSFMTIYSQADGAFGMEYEYESPQVLAKEECLYFELVLQSTEDWEGYLSFRAQDDTGFRSWVRYSIAFRNA